MMPSRVSLPAWIVGCLCVCACDPGGTQTTTFAEGGAGAAVVKPRTNAPTLDEVPVETRDELVDDLENGDLRFLLPDGEGYWIADRAAAIELAAADGGANDTELALHATSGGTLSSFSAVLSHPDAPSAVAHDYSSCEGIELWAKLGENATETAGKLVVSVESAGGVSYAELPLSAEWQEFTLEWSDFGPPSAASQDGEGGSAGAGGAVPGPLPAEGGAAPSGQSAGGAAGDGAPAGGLDPKTVSRLTFGQPEALDVWVDEIRLTGCELPLLNPPIPEPPELGTMGPAGSPVARYGQLRVDGSRLLDQSGNPVQLKGVSTQWLNWDNSPYPESKQTLEWLRDDWKLSVFRIAMGVSNAENVPLGYLVSPESTRERVERIIQNALDVGVYVIIDWHSHHADIYVEEARAFFSEMAKKYGQYPNIIYETFNEPLGRVVWSDVLKPYHQSVVTTIRREDPDNLVILGNPLWSQRVDEAAADPLRAANVAYTLHFYACTHSAWNRERAEIALGLGAPVFVSEFGLTDADGGTDGIVCEDEGNVWLDWMDANGISGVAWKLQPGGDSSNMIRQGASADGGWTEDDLTGHAPIVREWMRR